MAAPNQPPVDPVPAPAPLPPLTPGWKTSEAWLTAIAMILGILPNTGLLANAPLALKIVGLASSVLAALGYTANRTSLKRAHLVAHMTARYAAPPSSSLGARAATAAALVGLVVAAAIGCGSSSTGATSPIQAGGDAFLQCEGTDLSQDVGSGSLLATVATDIVSADYEKLIADLIAKLGGQVVGCAVIAVDTVAEAGKTSGAAALTPIEARARALIQKYGWKVAPKAPPPPGAGSGSAAAPKTGNLELDDHARFASIAILL